MKSKLFTDLVRCDPGTRVIGQEARQARARKSYLRGSLGDFPRAADEMVQYDRNGGRIARVFRTDANATITDRHTIGPKRWSSREAYLDSDGLSKPTECNSAILMLRASFPGGDHNPARPMNEPDRALGLVPMLPAGPADAVRVNIAFRQQPGVVEIEALANLLGRQGLFFVCTRHCEVEYR